MRAVLVVVALCARAGAQPEATLHDEAAPRDGTRIAPESTLQMRGDGMAVGAGVVARLVRGDHALSLGVMRWQTIELDRSRGSWELAVRGYRYLHLADGVRGHLVAGVNVERVERDGAAFTRTGALIGAGLSWEVLDPVRGFVEVTLERERWLEPPPGIRDDDEVQLMVMLGFTF